LFQVIALITPVFLLIVTGYWARHSGFLAEGFWAPAEKLGYWVLLPALIVDSLATNELTAQAGTFAIIIAITVIGLSAITFLIAPFTSWAPGSFASVHQGTVRLNGLLAIAATIALFGPRTLPLLAIMVATWVPLSNGLSVYAYVRNTPGKKLPFVDIAIAVVKNPMVFAVIVGMSLNLLGAGPFIDQFFLFELLGRAALPIGLLTVGAALNMAHLRSPGPRVGTALALKLVVMPALVAGLCVALEATPLVSAVAILCACMPSSPSGYTVAKHLAGDYDLMATIITAQTVLSVVTVSAWAIYASSLLH
jgi:malonate transporter and related proteins